MFPGSIDPFYSKLLYKMGHFFLDTQYIYAKPTHCVVQPSGRLSAGVGNMFGDGISLFISLSLCISLSSPVNMFPHFIAIVKYLCRNTLPQYYISILLGLKTQSWSDPENDRIQIWPEIKINLQKPFFKRDQNFRIFLIYFFIFLFF